MRVLLVRPDAGNERFGLGPFFRAEPLGMEYVGAALRKRGDDVSLVDLRFGGSLARWLRRVKPQVEGQPWFKFDTHHLLWEPRLGPERFFELYAETWRRSILNLRGSKSLLSWMRQVRPTQMPYIARVLLRTQRMMRAGAYLDEHRAACRVKELRQRETEAA